MEDSDIKILIVEDSTGCARTLTHVFSPFHIVGVATNGVQAIQLFKQLHPDVMTMDINLPDINGLALTKRILAERYIPIIVVSASVSPEKQRLIFDALQAGAYDIVPKARFIAADGDAASARKLQRLIRAAVSSRGGVTPRKREPVVRAKPAIASKPHYRILAIGASTGGPPALCNLFRAFQGHFPLPILVCQHMCEGFTEGFVGWLREETRFIIELAENGSTPQPSVAYFPPSGYHMEISCQGTISLVPRKEQQIVCPSVDGLFRSVGEYFGGQAICLLMTGMGADGAEGLLRARQCGALTAVQDEQSSMIFGMPKEALRLGATELSLHLDHIAPWLEQLLTTP